MRTIIVVPDQALNQELRTALADFPEIELVRQVSPIRSRTTSCESSALAGLTSCSSPSRISQASRLWPVPSTTACRAFL